MLWAHPVWYSVAHRCVLWTSIVHSVLCVCVCVVPHSNYMQIIFIVWYMIRVHSYRLFHASFWASFMDREIHRPHPTLLASLPLQVGSRLVPKEVALLLRLDHRYIIQLVDYFEEEEKYVIVMERPEKYIDLFDYITQKEVLSERTAKHLFRWARGSGSAILVVCT